MHFHKDQDNTLLHLPLAFYLVQSKRNKIIGKTFCCIGSIKHISISKQQTHVNKNVHWLQVKLTLMEKNLTTKTINYMFNFTHFLFLWPTKLLFPFINCLRVYNVVICILVNIFWMKRNDFLAWQIGLIFFSSNIYSSELAEKNYVISLADNLIQKNSSSSSPLSKN
jgi:hypothetical protein